MREIKFRAWDGESEAMHLWGDTMRIILADVLNKEMNPKAVVMQFTGLLDKNGKEIFEGDIVSGNYWVGEVSYTAPFFKVHRIDSDGEVEEDFLLGDYDCEVIGNKFENSELLK